LNTTDSHEHVEMSQGTLPPWPDAIRVVSTTRGT